MPEKVSHFPKRFLWGAATSAHQVEGGNHNQWTVWELEHAKALAAQAEYQFHDLGNWEDIKPQAKNPNNYISGDAADHYRRFEEDFDVLKKLGLNCYRFSVEWSRIEPTEGAWNVEAIEHYKQYVLALKRRNIEPMVTLFHFTLPCWFAQKGGFEKRSNVKYFTRYAEKILSELGVTIKYVITINEPKVYASQSYLQGAWPPAVQSSRAFWKVLNNLIYVHNKTARLIHGLNRRYKVSIAKSSPYDYPGDDARLSRMSARAMQYADDDYVLKRVVKTCDFIGVNYYMSNRVYGYRVHNPDERLSDMGWDMQPENLEYVLERLYRKYKLPLIVTENGLADASDDDRKWWLGKTMIALQQAIAEGVRVDGYIHWSLLDNFEWTYGNWPAFGLVQVDPKTLDRTIRPSAEWWSRMLTKVSRGA